MQCLITEIFSIFQSDDHLCDFNFQPERDILKIQNIARGSFRASENC